MVVGDDDFAGFGVVAYGAARGNEKFAFLVGYILSGGKEG
jgi:hypothetical protein